jgi:hypothetical protein
MRIYLDGLEVKPKGLRDTLDRLTKIMSPGLVATVCEEDICARLMRADISYLLSKGRARVICTSHPGIWKNARACEIKIEGEKITIKALE